MSTNQRDSYRCASREPGQKAVLTRGRKRVVVELLDQSRGGFAVSCPHSLRVRPRDVVALRTNMGWCEAEVVHVHRVNAETRIGLLRRRELADPRQAAELHRSSVPWLVQFRSLKSSGWSLPTLVCCIAIGLAACYASSQHRVRFSNGRKGAAQPAVPNTAGTQPDKAE